MHKNKRTYLFKIFFQNYEQKNNLTIKMIYIKNLTLEICIKYNLVVHLF